VRATNMMVTDLNEARHRTCELRVGTISMRGWNTDFPVGERNSALRTSHLVGKHHTCSIEHFEAGRLSSQQLSLPVGKEVGLIWKIRRTWLDANVVVGWSEASDLVGRNVDAGWKKNNW
jgi:hypothetical protein